MKVWRGLLVISIIFCINSCKSESGEPNNTGTPAKELAQTEKWGEDVNGLRIRIEFVPNDESYSIGQEIGILLHVQNVSDDSIQLARVKGQTDPGIWTIEDPEKTKIKMSMAKWTGARRIEREILKPGDEVVFELVSLNIGTQGKVRADISEPGTYTARYKYSFNKLDEKDWKGSLETGEYNLVIAP